MEEGFKITSDSFFVKAEPPQTLQPKLYQTLMARGIFCENYHQGLLKRQSTLNILEIKLYPEWQGSRVVVDYGITSLGLILGIILLIFGIIGGVVIGILWYLKMDEERKIMKETVWQLHYSQ